MFLTSDTGNVIVESQSGNAKLGSLGTDSHVVSLNDGRFFIGKNSIASYALNIDPEPTNSAATNGVILNTKIAAESTGTVGLDAKLDASKVTGNLAYLRYIQAGSNTTYTKTAGDVVSVFAHRNIAAGGENAYGFYSELSNGTGAATNKFNFFAEADAPNFFKGNTYIGGTTTRNTRELWESLLTEEQKEELEAGTLAIPANVETPGDGSFFRQWWYDQQSAEDQALIDSGELEYPEKLQAENFVDSFALGDNANILLVSSGFASFRCSTTGLISFSKSNSIAPKLIIQRDGVATANDNAIELKTDNIDPSFSVDYLGGIRSNGYSIIDNYLTIGSDQTTEPGIILNNGGAITVKNTALSSSGPGFVLTGGVGTAGVANVVTLNTDGSASFGSGNITLNADGLGIFEGGTIINGGYNNAGNEQTGLAVSNISTLNRVGIFVNLGGGSPTKLRPFTSYVASSGSVGDLIHFNASQDSASTYDEVKGFAAQVNLQNATTNAYGFWSNLSVGNGKNYNFYAAGAAPNYFAGMVGVGVHPSNTNIGQTGELTFVGGSNPRIYSSIALNTNCNVFLSSVSNNTGERILINIGQANADAPPTIIGNISHDGSTVSFNTTSDYRLKTNIQPLNNASALLAQLKPVTYEYKNKLGTTYQGFIAHELQEVDQKFATGTKDAIEAIGTLRDALGNILEENVTEPSAEEMTYKEQELVTPYVAADPENGIEEQEAVYETVTKQRTWEATGTRPVYQGVDQSKLIPLLTKALQEALERIEQLEAKLA